MRKLSSFSSREMRASAFRCAPAESSGATSRKKRWVGVAVERVEVDALPAARERREDPLDARQLAVRDRDAVAERRAVQPLAILERLDQALALELRVRRGHRVRQLDEDVGLAARGEVGEHQLLGENVLDLHAVRLERCGHLDEPEPPILAPVDDGEPLVGLVR